MQVSAKAAKELFDSQKLRQSTKTFLLESLFSAHARISGGKHNSLLWTYGQFELSPYDIMLRGYFQGVVPLPNMSNSQLVEWHDPAYRGIVPIETFKAQEGLIRVLKKNHSLPAEKQLEVRINTDFQKTIESCAQPRKKTSRTWLNPNYIDAALELHGMGIAHSIETYQNGILVGGVIGYAINSYFADITLFNTVDNASKVGYYYLLLKLRNSGFKLHDSGFGNNWFSQFGAVDMPRKEFKMNLTKAIVNPAKFTNEVPHLPF